MVVGHGTEASVAAYELPKTNEWAAFEKTTAGPASRGADNWKSRGSRYKLRSTEAEYGGGGGGCCRKKLDWQGDGGRS